MANLIDVAEELEFIPEDQLAAMIDDPNSRYPSFMVLSEVQRRTKMRNMYENEMSKMNQPQTTVAEEEVMGLMQGQGAMPMQAGMSYQLTPKVLGCRAWLSLHLPRKQGYIPV